MCKGLSFGYQSEHGTVDVLDAIEFTVASGEILGIVGPSGCGKTTILRLLADLVHPRQIAYQRGSIGILGGPPADARRARRLGMMLQNASLFPWRNVLENVLLPVQISDTPTQEAREQAKALLHLVGLTGFESSRVWELSGGMQQRVALVRSLINSPEVLMLDEPLASLDELVRDELLSLLQELWSRFSPTIVVVSHNLTDTVLLCDRIVVLSARPATILDVISVDLPRPRRFSSRLDERFSRALLGIRNALIKGNNGHGEASSAFAEC